MSKIFRLHTGASENIEHWQQIGGHISDNFINTIEDPAGSNINTQITSIPSPFARMDLIRTSFRFINSLKKTEGNTIYHRMVSECLDVAEIFFNIHAFDKDIEIIEWNSGIHINNGKLAIDVNSDLGKLINSTNPKHKLLGETLKMFLIQDKDAFNFDKLKRIYLLNYIKGPDFLNIIGGTSPSTLFFSSANNLNFVDINFGNDKMFDLKLCPLKNRGKDFIKYLYSFCRAYNGFSEDFSDFNNYLDQTFQELDESTKEIIRKINSNTYSEDYIKINVNDSGGNNVEILGFKLLAKNEGYGDEIINSNDFIINNSKPYIGNLPCILPIDAFNDELNYVGGKWKSNYSDKVPKYDNRPLEQRTLPTHPHIIYPFLTISDLLEPYIIKLPYPIDSDKFFDGNYTQKAKDKDHGYVLPIKKELLKYFTVKELQGVLRDGEKMVEISPMPCGVKVTLRVPIQKNNYVQLTRIYNNIKITDSIPEAELNQNIGYVLENQINLAVYPFFRTPAYLAPHYRVLFVDRDLATTTKENNYTLQFLSDIESGKSKNIISKKNRSNKNQAHGATTNYYIIEENFDYIEISHKYVSGILIPQFKDLPTPAHTFKFAIDFGTTNTHIEYKTNTLDSRPFEITEKDIQFATLHEPTTATENALSKVFGEDDLIKIIDEEFLPRIIGKDVQHKFPQRTVINDNGMFNPDVSTYALGDFNIPFWYLKEDLKLNSEITSNLKWSDFKNNKKLERRTKGFLKQIMLMIRNKVLLNNGSLDKTEIIWFYPSSMPTFRVKFLKDAWETYYKRYFNGAKNILCMSESLAPFYYFKEKAGVRASAYPVALIDIGGGTSDTVIYKDNKPNLLTSFRFASNSLFGDGFGNTSGSNGFVLRFEKEIRDSLSNTPAKKLMEIYDGIKSKNGNSLELIEFFFSLEENKIIKDNRLPISFSKLLSDDTDFKIVFLVYYAAIIYHISKLMKVKEYDFPRYITFSGNGSRVIKIITGSSDLSDLSTFTKIIFEDVFGKESTYNIELKLEDNPKEITCKGGLEIDDFSSVINIEESIKNVLIGTLENNLVRESGLHYSQIKNSEIIDSVISEVNNFIDRFFEWNSKINYYNKFGINPGGFEKYKYYLKENIKTFLIDGIDEKLKETQDNINVNIEETLFFYPLNGCLNKLAYNIYKDSSQN